MVNPMTQQTLIQSAACRAQRGVTMLVVLVLLSVMLLGGLALARLTEIGTLASGNSAYHEAAMQASEIGLNTAFLAVRNLADENAVVASWYSPIALAKDATSGLPTGVDWSAAPQISVGVMTVRYVAERACTAAVLTDPLRQCLVKQSNPKDEAFESRDASREKPAPPNSRQFRITVQVTGPKGTRTWVQSLVTRG
jgi:type IV pilus assembly protein PilX